MDKKSNSGLIDIHKEIVIAKFRLDIDKFSLESSFRTSAAFWMWEGLSMQGSVTEDPNKLNRLLLYQIPGKSEDDLFYNNGIPHTLGYVDFSYVYKRKPKPLDLRLVCTWQGVASFWEHYVTHLRDKYSVLDDPNDVDYLKSKLPKNQTRLGKWRFIAYKLDPSDFPGGLKHMGSFIIKNYPSYPYSREVLSLIYRAKAANLIEPPKKENSDVTST